MLEGRYMNYFAIGSNAFEFILDFGQYNAEDENAQMHTRIVTSPVFAKLLAQMLNESVESFESEHGRINPATEETDRAGKQPLVAGGEPQMESP